MNIAVLVLPKYGVHPGSGHISQALFKSEQKLQQIVCHMRETAFFLPSLVITSIVYTWDVS